MPSFSAVLLAGGASKRMGRDKALLGLPGSNILLWQRQWHLLEQLQPAQIFWSGPARPQMPERAVIISDVVTSAGPLGGISACMDALPSELLVVLAIDLPHMSAAFLRGLLARCAPGHGAVAQHDAFFEPLAAVYPKRLSVLAADHLAQGRYAMHDFIREAVQQKALATVQLEEPDRPLFKNLNAPSDLTDA
jgi:molybdenum cofactor guanylyltransferase